MTLIFLLSIIAILLFILTAKVAARELTQVLSYLGGIIAVCGLCYALFLLGVFIAAQPRPQRAHYIEAVSLSILAAIFLIALSSDVKANKKIRSGDQDAFDKRVSSLMTDRGYTRDQAVASVQRIKEGVPWWRSE